MGLIKKSAVRRDATPGNCPMPEIVPEKSCSPAADLPVVTSAFWEDKKISLTAFQNRMKAQKHAVSDLDSEKPL